jgi:uncharacterized membrane protein
MSDGAAAVPRRRGVLIALIASLAINVFLAGWIAASFVQGRPAGPRAMPAGPGAPFNLMRARLALEPAARAKVDAVWRDVRPEMRARAQAARAARQELQRQFAAEPLDPAKLDAAIAEVRRAGDQLSAVLLATMGKTARALSAAERKTFFDAGTTRPPAGERRGPPPDRN